MCVEKTNSCCAECVISQDKKSDRVEQLLKETEAYLEKLGVKLREQKGNTMGKSIQMKPVVEIVAGKNQTQVGHAPTFFLVLYPFVLCWSCKI